MAIGRLNDTSCGDEYTERVNGVLIEESVRIWEELEVNGVYEALHIIVVSTEA